MEIVCHGCVAGRERALGRCSGLLRGEKYENPAAISQRRLNNAGLSTLAFELPSTP